MCGLVAQQQTDDEVKSMRLVQAKKRTITRYLDHSSHQLMNVYSNDQSNELLQSSSKKVLAKNCNYIFCQGWVHFTKN